MVVLNVAILKKIIEIKTAMKAVKNGKNGTAMKAE